MNILTKVLIPKRKNYSIFLKISFSPKKSRRTLVTPAHFTPLRCIPTHQPWNPLRIHRRRPPTSLNSSSVDNRGLVASVVMFFVTTAQNYLSTLGLKAVELEKGQKGKQLCSFHSHANDANYSLRSQLASFTICLFVFAFFAHFTTVMQRTKKV